MAPIKKTIATGTPIAKQLVQDKEPVRYPLELLLLDEQNPRFGFVSKKKTGQSEILNRIVTKFGVDDVLSSLAVNGYFEAEPLVCRLKKGSKYATVVEGNRRLAACLILTGDQRAVSEVSRTEQFKKIWKQHDQKPVDPVPVILFKEEDQEHELLSYLGVRHIASAQPWDSYAKAAWVARIIEENNIDIDEVALMIGDQNKTVSRLLQGYYFINQLQEAGEFRPEDSVRRGRGSVAEYPFSWVYTILGYKAVRDFLEIEESDLSRDAIKKKNIRKASMLTRAMFGDKSKGRNSAISDSRELGELASVLNDAEKIALLEAGKSVEEIIRMTKPIEERLRDDLTTIREIQSEMLKGMTEQGVEENIATPLVGLAEKNRRSAAEVEKKLKAFASGEEIE